MDDKTAERFWDKVDRRGDDECWEWTASKIPSGYGAFRHKGKTLTASRVAWKLTNGPIPDGEHYGTTCVCHKCDNPACCNPGHLFLGTQQDNIADMFEKGRDNRARGIRHGMSKLTDTDVRLIKIWLGLGYFQQEIADAFGVCQVNISSIKLGNTWRHVEV